MSHFDDLTRSPSSSELRLFRMEQEAQDRAEVRQAAQFLPGTFGQDVTGMARRFRRFLGSVELSPAALVIGAGALALWLMGDS